MTQFVRKTLLGGFAEVPGGQNDPECSHVLMDREEYDRMLRYISEKEWAVTQARNEGDNALAMANRSAREALAQAEKEAGVHRTLFGGKGLSVSGRKEAH